MSTTAIATLPPEDLGNNLTSRQQHGLALEALLHIERGQGDYRVPSQSDSCFYTVNRDADGPTCTGLDFDRHQQPCKHIYAVDYTLQREGEPERVAPGRPTYGQRWSTYDRAQAHLDVLLRELCDLVPQPDYSFGRLRPPVSDMLYCIGLKGYSNMSRRRAMTSVKRARERGLLLHSPSPSSISRYLENPGLTPLVKFLVQQSALPLADIGQDFAVNTTRFATTAYDRCFDHKWGRPIQSPHWVKLHATAVEATDSSSNDSPQFPGLMRTTSEGFDVREVSADKGYLSKANYDFADSLGADAYIMFKTNSKSRHPKRRSSIPWEKAHRFFSYHREDFLQHYHKRSNVETVFQMIKSKFGASMKSKTETGQFNIDPLIRPIK